MHLCASMEAQALLLATPLFMPPLRKKSSPIIVKSLACITTKRHHVVVASNATVTAPRREKDPKKRVVITGMGLVSVFGNDVDKYYYKLLAGENGITFIDKFNASNLPVRFGGQIRGFSSDGYIDEKNEQTLDDCQRYCIVAGKKALEDAALGILELSKINKERAGVLVGSALGCMSRFSDSVKSLNITHDFMKSIQFSTPHYMINSPSALLAIDLGFMGPNYWVFTSIYQLNISRVRSG
ncbi:3-oxoacyl-[acyl-carrier-protein] synthase I, chloroplastic-like protein [Tanacetum coccineum]